MLIDEDEIDYNAFIKFLEILYQGSLDGYNFTELPTNKQNKI